MSDPNVRPPRPAPVTPTGLTPDQIARWAERIADGRDEFPADVADPDRSALAAAVRGRLRDRLVRHVARAIAGRLARPDDGP
jgi:predicted RNA-binding Zn ribbon-like protein